MRHKDAENRYIVFHVSNRQMLELITGNAQIKNIPEWSTLMSVEKASIRYRDGWFLQIHHPSFPEREFSHDIGSNVYPEIELEYFETSKRKLAFD